MSNSKERLQKVIAQSGITSRRKAEQLIQEGKVKVNQKVVTKLGTKVTANDEIEVDGMPLEKEAPVYFMLYKPRGVISSLQDDKGRKVVTDLLGEVDERVFPIGRLDYDTSGILILTNDGEFANLLMHPRYEVDKVYIAKVKGTPEKSELAQLRKGVRSDGDLLKAIQYRVLSTDRKNNHMILQLTLREGKNRHVRRMMDGLGYPVLKLKRENYGLLTLDGLKPGEYRPLTPKEVKQMRNLATKNVEE
ncbi:MAG: pseudouridine synthase [Bacillota bacterium]|uniref:pseudouridine synthase n=1 Tax=Virgibacillus TaxID=84406 RepID=UPI00042A22F4|nr:MULTISPECIES: pseudouridine synthase [Bacillaceae]MCC2249059.1 rRNA pseudouridine synthase [Virgibacillus sp. AGTR]MDY7043419.1 pseudouridine synthase [Virgibacillus sp. M23]QRZ16977.1 rRNA pseudouridine synthase [Virgibacillus sp. AGTR]WBX79232.1 pseudouridine synthase [Virgibacillus salarius]